MTLKQYEDQAVTLDAGCAERSCACYSPQFGDTDGVPYYPESIVRQQQAEIEALKSHPVKELTDEEILQQAEWMFGTHFFECIDDQYWIEFAKAILRKAQENE